jgi:[ribosomal protein S5]-alanine N-acetyltransferase
MIDIYKLKSSFPIDGANVKLNLFTESNITDDYLNWLNDPAVVKYSNQRFTQHTHQTSSDYLQTFVNSENLFLAIYLKENEKFVGTMSVYISTAHETADIGIMIGDRTCWRIGVGGDAWKTILNWLIDVVRVRKVTGGTLRCNAGMVNILINSGMHSDGLSIAQELVEGKAQDILYFAKFQANKFNK